MPFTTREIDSPDPVTRVAAADAALREPEQHDIGEKMVLNMGPSHPATHGVLRLVLELDGELITKATPDIGFLHRGDEKIAENMQYNQFVPYTDRLDYLAPLSNNVAYALAVEKLMDWDIPPRGKAIRTICCETSRISSHLLGLGAMALDLGAMSVFLYTFTEREKLYNLFELLTGARFTTSYTRVGGQIRDLPESFIPQLKIFLDDFGPSLDECDRLLTRNKIFVDRTKDVGMITKERAFAYAISVPNLRGSGLAAPAHLDPVGFEQAEDQQHERRLASAVGAEQAYHTPGGDLEVDVVEHEALAEALRDASDREHPVAIR